MKQSAEEYESLIAGLYDSVLDDSHWSQALKSMMHFLGGTGVACVVADPSRALITHCDAECVDPEYSRLYLERFATRDIRLVPALNAPVGRVLLSDELARSRVLRRTDLYADLLKPADVPNMLFAWLRKSPHSFVSMVIQGSRHHGPFDEAAREGYIQLMPHLRRAVMLREKLSALRTARDSQLRVVDSLPLGIVFLDGRGEVLESTPIAEEMFRAGTSLCVRERRVRAIHTAADGRLQHAIRACVRDQPDAALRGATLAMPRGADRPPLMVTVMPVRDVEITSLVSRPATLLLIVDPQHAPYPRTRFIQQTLGLTRAEAQLATALFDGASLREASAALERSINTSKTQLKSIYAKTGSRSHAELARVLLQTTLMHSRSNERSDSGQCAPVRRNS